MPDHLAPVLNLDFAAAGRSAPGTVDAVVRHLRAEADLGGYVAQQRAEPEVARLRDDLGALLGVPADGVALVESASTALDLLLDAWPLPAGARVAVAPSEWGPNTETFRRAGLQVVPLPVESDGVVDVAALLETLVADKVDVVHLTAMSAHRGLAQPVGEVLTACRRAGVPFWLDAAQGLGHVPVDAGADATYATSRKWLAGPRGVGVLAVAERHWETLRARRRAKHPADLPPVRTLEPDEAYVAGRVGLAAAVGDLVRETVAARAARLDEVGDLTRAGAAALDGWEVLGARHRGAITSLVPTRGQDVVQVREWLLAEHGILTTPVLPWRAPGELDTATLRLSPGPETSTADLDRVTDALGQHRSTSR